MRIESRMMVNTEAEEDQRESSNGERLIHVYLRTVRWGKKP